MFAEDAVPFDASHIVRQIEAGGGTVLREFDLQKVQAAEKGCSVQKIPYSPMGNVHLFCIDNCITRTGAHCEFAIVRKRK